MIKNTYIGGYMRKLQKVKNRINIKKNNLLDLNHSTRTSFDGKNFIFLDIEKPEKEKTCLSGYFKKLKGLYKN